MCCTKLPIILSSTATTEANGTSLVITPNVPLVPENEQGVKILITTATPAAGANLPVVIKFNGADVALLDKYGNIVYGNQIYDNQVLKGYFGNNGINSTQHFQLIRIPTRYYY